MSQFDNLSLNDPKQEFLKLSISQSTQIIKNRDIIDTNAGEELLLLINDLEKAIVDNLLETKKFETQKKIKIKKRK